MGVCCSLPESHCLTGLLFGLAPARVRLRRGVFAARERKGGETPRPVLWKKPGGGPNGPLGGDVECRRPVYRPPVESGNIDLGFRRDHVLLVTLDPVRSGYSGEQLSLAYQELLWRLETIPGVRTATLSATTPISGAAASRFRQRAEGHLERPEDRRYISVN